MEDPGSRYSAILSYVKLACFLLYNFTIKECSFLMLSCRLLWFVYSKQVLLLAAYIYIYIHYLITITGEFLNLHLLPQM